MNLLVSALVAALPVPAPGGFGTAGLAVRRPCAPFRGARNGGGCGGAAAVPARRRVAVAAPLLGMLAAPVATAHAARAAEVPLKYRIENLGVPGEGFNELAALNNRGEVAINVRERPAGFSEVQPFVYAKGHFTSYGDRFFQVSSLGDRGDVVGTVRDSFNGTGCCATEASPGGPAACRT